MTAYQGAVQNAIQAPDANAVIKSPRFAMLDTKWLSDTSQPLTGRELRTLAAIASFADWNKCGFAFPGREKIANVAGIEPRDVSASLKALEREGLLTVIRRRNNVYFVAATGFWPEKRMPPGSIEGMVLAFRDMGATIRTGDDLLAFASQSTWLQANPVWAAVLENILNRTQNYLLDSIIASTPRRPKSSGQVAEYSPETGWAA